MKKRERRREQLQPGQRLAGKAGTVALAATLFWACLAIGGVPTWAVLGLTGLALSAATLNLYARRFRVDAGVIVLLGLALYTTLQSVFVPLEWVRWLDADTHRTWARVEHLVGGLPRATLSLEPLTTRLEGLKLLSYAAVWGGVSARARETGPVYFARWVVWLALAVFALVFLHGVAGLQRVYGLYESQANYDRAWVGPLLNPNNLAGLCNLGALCAVACSTRSELHPARAPLYLLAASVLAAMSVLTGSRGAVLALLVGVLLLSLSWLSRYSGQVRIVQRLSGVGGVFVGGGLVVAFLALAVTDDTSRALGDVSLSKLKLFDMGLEVLSAHPWWGIGRGAFGAEAGTVHGLAEAVVFTYVENFVLEWLVGWGVVVGGLALAAVGVGIFLIRGGFRTRVLKVSLCVVLLQNLVDLGLELPGVAMPWLVVFAACWSGATRRTWALPRLENRWWLLAAGLLPLTLLTLPGGDVARVDRARATAARGASNYETQLANALRLHPGDAFLLRLGAVRAAEQSADDTLTWINAALLRAPNDGRTHLVLAEVLRKQGRVSQALLSLRAAAADPALAREVIQRALAWAPQRLLQVAPQGESGARLLIYMAQAVRDLNQRRALLLEAKRRAPHNWVVTNALVNAEIARVAAAVPDCRDNRAACFQRIRDGIVELEQKSGAERAVRVLRAREMMLHGEHQAAYEQLLVGCERQPSDEPCLSTLLAAARELDDDAWRTAARAYLDGVCRGGIACTHPRLIVAGEFYKREDWASALDAYSTATSMATTPAAHVGAARAAQRLGREREALHWLTKAERTFSQDAEALQTIRKMRQSLGVPQRPPTLPRSRP